MREQGVAMSREGSWEEASLPSRPVQVELDTGLQGGEQRRHIQSSEGLNVFSAVPSPAALEKMQSDANTSIPQTQFHKFYLLSTVIAVRTVHRFPSHWLAWDSNALLPEHSPSFLNTPLSQVT